MGDTARYYQDLAYERLIEIKRLAAENRKLAEENKLLQDAMRWRDARVEAPEEKTSVLFLNHAKYIQVGCLINGDGKWHCGCEGTRLISEDSWFWMPLPTLPDTVRVIEEISLTHVSVNADGTIGIGGTILKSHTEMSPSPPGKTGSPVGGHMYSFNDDHKCIYGCGCWMGATRSGGPDGIDPFGKCPKYKA